MSMVAGQVPGTPEVEFSHADDIPVEGGIRGREIRGSSAGVNPSRIDIQVLISAHDFQLAGDKKVTNVNEIRNRSQSTEPRQVGIAVVWFVGEIVRFDIGIKAAIHERCVESNVLPVADGVGIYIGPAER